MEAESAESEVEVEVEHGQLWRRVHWVRASTQIALHGAATWPVDGWRRPGFDSEGPVTRAVNM